VLYREMTLRLRKKLKGGEAVFGPFMKTLDPAFVETAGFAGFDYAILDMEHGPVGTENLGNLLRAAQVASIAPIVRVPDISEQSIGKALDLGACGVQVPQVSTAEDARKAVRLAKFHPAGERGVCRYVRAAGYSSIPRSRYFAESNDALVILQLEGGEALENLDDILLVAGIDVIFIGPYDLSQSLGVPGEVDSPLVTAAVAKIASRAAAAGITVGTFVDDVSAARKWMDEGIRYISYSVDVGIFHDACRAIVGDLKGGGVTTRIGGAPRGT
jgi:4-hydroxy-2-oxoheptanedioate aldolase